MGNLSRWFSKAVSKNQHSSKRQLGHAIESQALAYLEAQGLQLLTRNYRCALGEIDLIMEEDDNVIFVEVRYRSSKSHGVAQETITWRKQNKIIKTAAWYLQKQRWHNKRYCRFDVVAAHQTKEGVTFDWIKNAFQ